MILNEGYHNNSHINTINDENIGNYGYISTLILWIYRRYIDGYFEKNFNKPKIHQNSWKYKKNFIEM